MVRTPSGICWQGACPVCVWGGGGGGLPFRRLRHPGWVKEALDEMMSLKRDCSLLTVSRQVTQLQGAPLAFC